MRRLATLLSVLMLVLFIWTGSSSAHAEQRFDCIPASSEATGHFDGDRDESRAKGEKGLAHHHSGCSGHHLGAVPDSALDAAPVHADQALTARRTKGGSGHSPDRQLRPPIA